MKHVVFAAGVAALSLIASGQSFAQGVGVQVGPTIYRLWETLPNNTLRIGPPLESPEKITMGKVFEEYPAYTAECTRERVVRVRPNGTRVVTYVRRCD